MSVLWGDPASVSALAAALRRAAARLAGDGLSVRERLREDAPERSGPRLAQTRQDVDAVMAGSARVAEVLDSTGRRLQSGATDLAATITTLRRLEEEAATLGLEVRDGTVRERWGIIGVADPAAARADEENRHRVQERLHIGLADLGRRRAALARDCATASQTLQECTAALRERPAGEG